MRTTVSGQSFFNRLFCETLRKAFLNESFIIQTFFVFNRTNVEQGNILKPVTLRPARPMLIL